MNWSDMFPEGRTIFYEGVDPEGFATDMRLGFGFDPSEDDGWTEWGRFHCPAYCLDEVYGSGTWELGS